ncbi:MAG: antiterminator LoaP [Dorea sp.]|uniref:antiterminator LoaP n=1 Tax=Sporofaciens musculi TaxID=2681861 RepID=UPI00216FA3FC|nr:antiterminator LoaP [Sporofaciens musculi]MCI9421134.1 antiterminator LoaP [Dorea sp.]
MIFIWYLIQCQKQNEWKILNSCRQNISRTALKDAFIFTYDRMHKFHGEWHLEKRLMFPTYVFLESDHADALVEELKQYEGIVDLLRASGKMIPVQKNEEMFLSDLCGKSHHLGMSKGVIRDGITQIMEGPLQGLEERICRIDRHKRLAKVEAPKSLPQGSILAGLEIVEKS